MPYRYALATDDAALNAIAVTASAEDAEYTAENLITENPANPAKLTTTTGSFVLQFAAPITPIAAVLVYHNLTEGLNVRLQGNSSDSWAAPPFDQAFQIPAHHEDGWPVSPVMGIVPTGGAGDDPWEEGAWEEGAWGEGAWAGSGGPPTYEFWRVVVVGTNANPVTIGRLMLITTLRTFGTSVQFGAVEEEEHGVLELPTELGVETVYALGGKRRSITGEMMAKQTEVDALNSLRRAAQGRTYSWMLMPQEGVNDAWLVRFIDKASSRSYVAPDLTSGFHQRVRFQVKEVARGIPWP